jgi:hypothetical protein
LHDSTSTGKLARPDCRLTTISCRHLKLGEQSVHSVTQQGSNRGWGLIAPPHAQIRRTAGGSAFNASRTTIPIAGTIASGV